MEAKELQVGNKVVAPNGKVYTIAQLKSGTVYFTNKKVSPLSAGWVVKGFKKYEN